MYEWEVELILYCHNIIIPVPPLPALRIVDPPIIIILTETHLYETNKNFTFLFAYLFAFKYVGGPQHDIFTCMLSSTTTTNVVHVI